MHVLGQDRHIFGAHHITCSGEKTLAKRATGMELRKVLGFEVAHFHQRHRQSIAHCERSSSAARRCEIERTGLFLHLHVYMNR